LFPAKEYGLVLSSHGTGWVPNGLLSEQSLPSAFIGHPQFWKENLLLTKNFGEYEPTNDPGIELDMLVDAIPFHLSFIIFDACLMSGIGVLYQLRNKAKIIIASPTEVLIAGFPYKKTIPLLLMPEPNYGEVALTYMEYYKNRPGNLQSASIAIIDTRQLEQLAYLVRSAIKEEIYFVCPNRNFIQRYDTRNPALLFDFEDYLEHAISNESNLIALKKHISRTEVATLFQQFRSVF
jgi:hypothetical protein